MASGSSSTAALGAAQSNERRELVEREILEQAARLFAERGYGGTALQDVANALGISRTALYYYVPSKEAILERLVEKLSEHDAQALGQIRGNLELTPTQQVEAMAYQVSLNASSNPQQTRILAESTHFFPAALLEANRRASAKIVGHFQGAIEAGMSQGEFRPVDSRGAAFSIVGMCIWTAWWMPQNWHQEPVDVARQIAVQARHALVARDRRSHRSTAVGLIDSIESQLDRLRTLLPPS